MAPDLCEPCQLPRSMCPHGLEDRRQQERERLGFWDELLDLAEAGAGQDVGPLIASRYPGRCPTCTRVREAGDLIAWCEDEGAWICADCAA
jgi:hypothetical protein